MRKSAEPYRLSFLLPEGADVEHALSVCYPFDNGCDIELHGAGLVVITGTAPRFLFSSAGDFLRSLCLGIGPTSIVITMKTEDQPGVRGGRDSWSAIIGAQVAFVPTSLPAHFPQLPARAPPPLAPDLDEEPERWDEPIEETK